MAMHVSVIKYCLAPVVLCLGLYMQVRAQHAAPYGARHAASAYSSLAIPDVWAVFNQPAALALLQQPAVALGYDNYFGIPELSQKSLAVALPTRVGHFGMGLSHFGYALFSQANLVMAYAMPLHPAIAAGISMEYNYLQIGGNYGNRGSISASAGLSFLITELVHLSTVLRNPVKTYDTVNPDVARPTVLRTSMAWNATPDLWINASAELGTDAMHYLATGVRYNMFDILEFSGGLASVDMEVFNHSAGMGVLLPRVNIFLAFNRSSFGPYSYFLSIEYGFGKKAKTNM